MVDQSEALVRVQSFLSALEAAETRPDNCATFSITDLPLGSDLAARIRERLAGARVAAAATREIGDWQAELRRLGSTWFAMQPDIGLACDRLVELLEALFPDVVPTGFYVLLTFEPGAPFYEAGWVDIVLSASERAYLIHLGVSD